MMRSHSERATHTHSDGSLVDAILEGVIALDRNNFDSMVAEIEARQDITPGRLIDTFIPHVARILGERWCSDHMSFAEVTIGSARLQSWVRDLDRSFDPSRGDYDIDSPTCLLVIPPDVFHTLGAIVALSQFRRAGASVRLLICQSADDLRETAANGTYDMIAISAPAGTPLDLLRQMINKVRKIPNCRPSIVIGGGLLECEPDIEILVGADFAARDPKEALELCGLKTYSSEPRSSKMGA
ncbi:MAG: cobalamin B12-binding domain-containing protein [Pseudomonadota bacterium]